MQESSSLTAFPETEKEMRQRFQRAHLDRHAFQRRYSPCDLKECHGTCCHDGAILGREEAEVLSQFVEQHQHDLDALGIDTSELLVERTDGGFRTKRVFGGHRTKTKGFPDHFPDTTCAFKLKDHRCALQVLSVQQGQHPWYWKPIACWMHPLAFHEATTRSITVYTKENDPLKEEGYHGFTGWTPCGKCRAEGLTGTETFSPELKFLGSIIGRDLIGELSFAPPSP